MLAGCASRRKKVHSIESKFRYSTQVDTAFTFQNILSYNFKKSSAYQLQQQFLSLSYDGAAGDSLSVEQYGPDGNLISKTVFKGKGKGDLKSGNTTETMQEDLSASGTEHKSGKASGNKDIKADAQHEALDKTISSSLLPYLWYLLLLVAIIVLWWLNKRFGWLKSLKFHVTGKSS